MNHVIINHVTIMMNVDVTNVDYSAARCKVFVTTHTHVNYKLLVLY